MEPIKRKFSLKNDQVTCLSDTGNGDYYLIENNGPAILAVGSDPSKPDTMRDVLPECSILYVSGKIMLAISTAKPISEKMEVTGTVQFFVPRT